MKMHNPPHPGEVLRELCVKPLGLTVTQTPDGARRESEHALPHPQWLRRH